MKLDTLKKLYVEELRDSGCDVRSKQLERCSGGVIYDGRQRNHSCEQNNRKGELREPGFAPPETEQTDEHHDHRDALHEEFSRQFSRQE